MHRSVAEDYQNLASYTGVQLRAGLTPVEGAKLDLATPFVIYLNPAA